MGFAASGAVAPLEWDLRPYIDAHGVTPEPSQAKLDAYSTTMMGLFDQFDLDLPATASERDIDAALTGAVLDGKSMSEAAPELAKLREQITKTRVKAACGVCSGKPTIEQVSKLPPRLRESFLGWVAGWAADPTLSQDAMSPSPAP